MGAIFWVATARAGVSHHDIAPGARQTKCGRWRGGVDAADGPARGFVLNEDGARELKTVPCKVCYGQTDVSKPTVVRTGRA